MKTYIYTLSDPLTNDVRYIGKANNPTKRFKEHIYDIKRKNKQHFTYKENWIKSLLKQNLLPLLTVIDEVDVLEYEKWEAFYIDKYKNVLHCKLVNSDETGLGMISNIKKLIEISTTISSKEIKVYNLNGLFISYFKSLREAAKFFNLSHANISRCCNKKYTQYGGYIFRFSNDNDVICPIIPKLIKKVLMFDLNNNFIKEYNTIREAAIANKLDCGNISKVCNGINKTINKKIFKFKENDTNNRC